MGKVIIIARVGKEKGEKVSTKSSIAASTEGILGYRIMDMFSRKVKDISIKDMIEVMSKNANIVINAELGMGGLIGTNGDLRRYPIVGIGERYNGLQLNKPCTILYKHDNGGFTLSDCWGRILIEDNPNNVIKIVERYGLTNGKVVTKDKTKFISAIHGEFPVIKRNNLINVKETTNDYGEIEKYYKKIANENKGNDKDIKANLFVARCIDKEKYTEKSLDKIKNYMEDCVKTGNSIDLGSYYLGNMGGNLYGVQIKKIKTAIRVLNSEREETKESEFSSVYAIPADKLLSVGVTSKDNEFILHIDRVIFGDEVDIGIRDTIIYNKDGKQVNTDVYLHDEHYKGKKKVNKARLEKYLEFEKRK